MNELWQESFDWQKISWPLDLSPNIIHVIRVRLDLPAEQWNLLRQYLSEDEIARADRFRFDEPRQRFITCRATLRQLLGLCCEIDPRAVPLHYGNHGKPLLSHGALSPSTPAIEFSVSHSGDLGLIAMTLGAEVGVDIEEFNSSVKILNLAERFFAPAEAEELRNLPPEKQLLGFYQGWTCKEAYIKATGRGLSLSLSSFCVTIDPSRPASLRHVDDLPDEPQRWTIKSLKVAADYAAAVMSARPHCQIECWNWPVEASQ